MANIAKGFSEAGSDGIIKKALEAPIRQLLDNGTTYAEMPGIQNAAIVVKNAVRNAISLAGTALTAQIVITLPKKSKEEMELEILQARQRPY